MRTILLRTLSVVAATYAAILLTAVGVDGQTPARSAASAASWTTPRTPWGDPDLQGIYNSNDNVGVPVERPARFGTRMTLTDEEFAERQKEGERAARDDKSERRARGPEETGDGPEHWYERGRTSRRTSLVIDPPNGIIPLKPEMRKRFDDWATTTRFAKGIDTWQDLDLWDRCITKGFPAVMVPMGYNNAYHIMQSPGYVAIVYEVIHDIRIIPLDGRPALGGSIRQWWGDSRGRWEGDTLVVDVTNFSDKTLGNQQPMGSHRGGGSKQHIRERFKRTSADSLLYSVTLTDPEAFSAPWTMELPLAKDDKYKMYEYACHEGNYSIVNMLSGARAMEKAQKVSDETRR